MDTHTDLLGGWTCSTHKWALAPQQACPMCSQIENDRSQNGNALDAQEGGDHYRTMKIQPVEFIHANGIDFMAGCAIKYLSRHRQKGQAEDIRKAIHFCQLILQLEYGEKG